MRIISILILFVLLISFSFADYFDNIQRPNDGAYCSSGTWTDNQYCGGFWGGSNGNGCACKYSDNGDWVEIWCCDDYSNDGRRVCQKGSRSYSSITQNVGLSIGSKTCSVNCTTNTYYRDNDGDGYGDPNYSFVGCSTQKPANYVSNSSDCDDTNPAIKPGATEVCDGLDNDCDGLVDEGLFFTSNCNQTGACSGSKRFCIAGQWSGCSILPTTEICDGLDNDCDGLVDEGVLNACGQCGEVPEEVCDGLDNDCDGLFDEDFLCVQNSLKCETDILGNETCVSFCDEFCQIIDLPEDPVSVIDGPYINYVGVKFDISGQCKDVDDGVASCNWGSINGCDITDVSKSLVDGEGTTGEVIQISGKMTCSSAGNYNLSLTVVDKSSVSITSYSGVTIQTWNENYYSLFNTAPTEPIIELQTNSNNAGATLVCLAESTDPDTGFFGGQTIEYKYAFYKNNVLINGLAFENNTFTTGTVSGEGKYTCLAVACDGIVCVQGEISNEITLCNIFTTWDSVGKRCVPNPELGDNNTFVCAPKPQHSVWDDVASYTQEFDGTNWVPLATTTSYSGSIEKNSVDGCYFVCENCFSWNGSECVPGAGCRSTDCELPQTENFVWTSNNGGSYTQILINDVWTPPESKIQTEYVGNTGSEEPCKFSCATGYTWNGTECVSELNYCGLVGLNNKLVSAKIGENNLDLTFSISCSNPEAVPGVLTIVNSVSFFDESGNKINESPIMNACTTENVLITRTMDTNTIGYYSAIFNYGPPEFNCSRTVFFGVTDESCVTDGTGGLIGCVGSEKLNIPDNNLILVILILLVSMIILLSNNEKQ